MRAGCVHPCSSAAERYGATERFVDGLWRLGGVHRRAVARLPRARRSSPAASSRPVGCGSARRLARRRLGADAARRPGSTTTAGCSPIPASSDWCGSPPTTPTRWPPVPRTCPWPAWLGTAVGAPESASVMLGVAGLLGVGRQPRARRRPGAGGPGRPRPASAGQSPTRRSRRRTAAPGAIRPRHPPTRSGRDAAERRRRPGRSGADGRRRVADPHRAVRRGGRPALDRLHRRHGRLRTRRRRAARPT